MMSNYLLALLLAVPFACNAVEPGSTKDATTWPSRTPCSTCIPLQFGELDMRIPLSAVEGIAVLGSDLSAVHLYPAGVGGRTSITFMSLHRREFVGRYEDAKLLPRSAAMSNTELLNRLFAGASMADSFSRIRAIEQVDRASRLRKASREGLHMFWIHKPQPASDTVYITVDGSETTFMIAGELSEALLDAILANMRPVALP